MNICLYDRLNIAHAAVAMAGTSRPTGWLDDQIINPPSPDDETPDNVPKSPVSRPNKMANRKLKLAEARKMAANLDGYDAQIKGGRLQEGRS